MRIKDKYPHFLIISCITFLNYSYASSFIDYGASITNTSDATIVCKINSEPEKEIKSGKSKFLLVGGENLNYVRFACFTKNYMLETASMFTAIPDQKPGYLKMICKGLSSSTNWVISSTSGIPHLQANPYEHYSCDNVGGAFPNDKQKVAMSFNWI